MARSSGWHPSHPSFLLLPHPAPRSSALGICRGNLSPNSTKNSNLVGSSEHPWGVLATMGGPAAQGRSCSPRRGLVPPDPVLWDPFEELLGRGKPRSEPPEVVLDLIQDPQPSRIPSVLHSLCLQSPAILQPRSPPYWIPSTHDLFHPGSPSILNPVHPGSPSLIILHS